MICMYDKKTCKIKDVTHKIDLDIVALCICCRNNH